MYGQCGVSLKPLPRAMGVFWRCAWYKRTPPPKCSHAPQNILFAFHPATSSSKLVIMTVALTDTFAAHPSLASEVVEGELVVLHLDEGVYYGLDALGTRAWGRLSGGVPLGEVITELAREYPTEPHERISSDLVNLTRDLVEARLLVATTVHTTTVHTTTAHTTTAQS